MTLTWLIKTNDSVMMLDRTGDQSAVESILHQGRRLMGFSQSQELCQRAGNFWIVFIVKSFVEDLN